MLVKAENRARSSWLNSKVSVVVHISEDDPGDNIVENANDTTEYFFLFLIKQRSVAVFDYKKKQAHRRMDFLVKL